MTFIAGITLTDEEFTSQQAIEADLATQPQLGDLHNWLLLHNMVQCEPAIEKEGFSHIAELRELQSIKDLRDALPDLKGQRTGLGSTLAFMI